MSADDALRGIELRVEQFWSDKVEDALKLVEEHSKQAADERKQRERAEASLKDERTKAEATLKAERERLEKTIAEERSRYDEANKARAKALGAASDNALGALQAALEGERRAREAAEKRATEALASRPVTVENKIEKPMHPWRMEVIDRDRNGFVKAMRITPEQK